MGSEPTLSMIVPRLLAAQGRKEISRELAFDACAEISKLNNDLAAALARLEGVKLDAARYRWLREQDGSKGWYTVCGAVFGACRMGLMDDRIDAQLSALPADGGGK